MLFEHCPKRYRTAHSRRARKLLALSVFAAGVIGLSVWPYAENGPRAALAAENNSNEVCEKTTVQCSPDLGNNNLTCNSSDIYDHCAYGFTESGPNEDCGGLFEGNDCVQSAVPCASWYPGECEPIATGGYQCVELAGYELQYSTTEALQCVNK